ncbi:hypothetical protein LCGC14_1788200 [marine sediment metagenome]|uniref:DNA N-6-adenine-methyltransferase (Dam) n=1 Tax=marine sediment metagenome TaxID=412755 RepID=A0A0F9JSZ5_9ZZZZ
MNEGMYSSDRQDWATPWSVFNELNAEFRFTLDPCASAGNAKCKQYFTEEDNGLTQSWTGHTVFMNPPYGKDIKDWVYKAKTESHLRTHVNKLIAETSYPSGKRTIVVGLLPARTDTRWFHDHVYGKSQIRFLKGRIKFEGATNSAPFPSMVVIWGGRIGVGTDVIDVNDV